ncbi:MAG: lysophospholipid acyltransferase (LPLAT)-like uncharacterized protein [Pseudohongiellaceae bacterium]|jgi:lysophospholipid acyltransferase (LPLAT)-like uncharacterized protein
MTEPSRRTELKIKATALFADGLHRALTATYRTRFLNLSYARRRAGGERVRCIYAAWHETLWHGIGALRGEGVCTVVSTHRDGEAIARVMARQGYVLARGSSTRGGAQAMRDVLRVAKSSDSDFCFTVDGPKGPRREVKDGVLFTAAMTGLPIVPYTAKAERSWQLNSWDKLTIGKPCSPVVVHFGEEVQIPRSAAKNDGFEDYRVLLAEAMARSEKAVDEAMRSSGSRC